MEEGREDWEEVWESREKSLEESLEEWEENTPTFYRAQEPAVALLGQPYFPQQSAVMGPC